MSTTTDAVDQVFKVSIDGVVYALKLVEVGAKVLKTGLPALFHGGAAAVGFAKGTLTGDRKLQGEVSVDSMLRRGQGLAYYMIAEGDVNKFRQGAEQTTLLYSVSESLQTEKGKAVREVVVPRDQAPLLNNIIHLNGINVVKQVDIEQISAEPVQRQNQRPEVQIPTSEEAIKEANRQKNEEFLRQVREQMRGRENIPITDMEAHPINPPQAARREKTEPLSEAKLKDADSRKKKQGDITRAAGDRPSVKVRVEVLKQTTPDVEHVHMEVDALNSEK